MKKNKAGRFALLLVTAMALTGCSGKNRPDYTAEAMNVGGVSVPLGEVNFYLRYQQIQMQGFSAYFGEDFMNQDLMGMGTPYGETIRDTAVETLKEYYVVEAHAKELGVTLSQEEKGRIQEAAKAFLEANDSKALKAMSADETTVSHVLSLMTLQNKVYDDRAATIDTEVDPDLVAQKRVGYVMSSLAGTTDEEGNVTELTEEERGEKKTQMEALLAAAKESGDLSGAADAQGMNYSTLTYGQEGSTLDEAVESAADALAEGEISDLIEAEESYYIVCLESAFDEEATESARQNELSQRERDAYDNWYTPLLEGTEITTNDERIQMLTFDRIFSQPMEEVPEETVQEESSESEDGSETGEENE